MNSLTTYLPYIIYVSIAGYYILILLYMNSQNTGDKNQPASWSDPKAELEDDDVDPKTNNQNPNSGNKNPNM